MASHVLRRLDPAPADLASAWAEVFVRAARESLQGAGLPWDRRPVPPPFRPILDEAALHAEGTWQQRCDLDWQCRPLLLVACWWADVVGRRHWLVQAEVMEGPLGVGAGARIEGLHPLEWIAPELSGGWRTRGGAREYVVACECGVAGTPAEIGWAGAMCGPCFDRKQDGLPAAGPPALRRDLGPMDSFVLTASGRLVTVRRDRRPHLPALARVVKACDPPWVGHPAWGRRDEQAWARGVAVNERLLALGDSAGRITLVNVGNGETVEVRHAAEMNRLHNLAFAGMNRTILVCLSDPPARASEVLAFDCAAGKIGKLLYKADAGPASHGALAVSPMGRLVVVGGAERLMVFEAATGAAVEALVWPQPFSTVAVALGPDSTIYAAATGIDALGRWAQTPAEPPPRGLWGWLKGAAGRSPEAVRLLRGAVHSLTVSPEGGLVVGAEERAVVFWDGVTLEEQARIEIAVALRGLALTRNGQLLLATERGLVVWPWREMIGQR